MDDKPLKVTIKELIEEAMAKKIREAIKEEDKRVWDSGYEANRVG